MEPHEADRFLIEAIRTGDQRAWHQLIERYQGRLLAFARSRLGRGSDADDAIQETFLGFVTSLKHYDAGRSLETYLFAILRYKIGEVLTKKRRRAEITTGFDIEDDAPGLPEPSVSETPSRIVGPCPQLGQHNHEVFGGLLGLSDEEIERLVAEQVIY